MSLKLRHISHHMSCVVIVLVSITSLAALLQVAKYVNSTLVKFLSSPTQFLLTPKLTKKVTILGPGGLWPDVA